MDNPPTSEEEEASLLGHPMGTLDLPQIDESDFFVSSPRLNDTLYWGSFRPGIYHGLNTRHRSVGKRIFFGLMWSVIKPGQDLSALKLHHQCEQNDQVRPYGWRRHDGRRFGIQELTLAQDGVNLETSFIKTPPSYFDEAIDFIEFEEELIANEDPVMKELRLLKELFPEYDLVDEAQLRNQRATSQQGEEEQEQEQQEEEEKFVQLEAEKKTSVFDEGFFLSGNWRSQIKVNGRNSHSRQVAADNKPSFLSLYLYIVNGDSMNGSIELKNNKRNVVSVEGFNPDDIGAWTFRIDHTHLPASTSSSLGLSTLSKEKSTKILPKFHSITWMGFHIDPDRMHNVEDITKHALEQHLMTDLQSKVQAKSKRSSSRRRNAAKTNNDLTNLALIPVLPNADISPQHQKCNGYVFQVIIPLPASDKAIESVDSTIMASFLSHQAEIIGMRLAQPTDNSLRSALESRQQKSILEERLHGTAMQNAFSRLTGALLTNPKSQFTHYQNDLEQLSQQFDTQFEQRFLSSSSSSLDDEKREFAIQTFSNAMGSIGYFSGRPTYWWKGQIWMDMSRKLFTAVPSRPFFPRGFLWDEGFHQLLISQFDKELSMQMLTSWFNTMWDNGWISREQILGQEAVDKVPEAFRIGFVTVANPPTLLLALDKIRQLTFSSSEVIVADHEALESTETIMTSTLVDDDDDDPGLSEQEYAIEVQKDFLRAMLPRVDRWIQWIIETQKGNLDHSMRWRGRSADHTFGSGLDDYPRAPQPTDDELHLDLHCWVTMATRVVADLASDLDERALASKYTALADAYQSKLHTYFWSDHAKAYADVVGQSPTGRLQHAQHIGYVNLFPLFFGLIDPSSEQLGHTLQHLESANELWSDKAGIRSMSKSSKFFQTGENYWRGGVWININYLVLRGLRKHYYDSPGPYQQKVQQIYHALRDNIIQNMYEQYKQSGFIWEQYHPLSGEGQRSRPFTGWSALVVLIISEHYD